MNENPKRLKLSLRLKVHLMGTALILLFFVVGGWVLKDIYTDIRSELYRWFDVSCQNLVEKTAGNTVSFVFPLYDPSLDKYVKEAMDKDQNLKYCLVRFGENLSESVSFGEASKVDFKEFSAVIKDNGGESISSVTIHYSTALVEKRLRSLAIFVPLMVAGGLLAFVILLEWFILRCITKPLASLVRSSEIVSGGDLNHDARLTTGDEMETVAEAFTKMTWNLRGMVEKIRGVSESLSDMSNETSDISKAIEGRAKEQDTMVVQAADSIDKMDSMLKTTASNVESLFDAIGQSASSTTEMSASIGEVGKTTQSLATSVDAYASVIGELANSIKSIAQSVRDLDSLVGKTTGELENIDNALHSMTSSAGVATDMTNKVSDMVTNEGKVAIDRATSGFTKIKNTVDEAVKTITTLGQQVEGIGSVIDIISDLADQTKILSLNASIIAAQAGENGRSFAVVANEIRELAMRTGSYLDEISKNIRAIQTQAGTAVVIVNQGSRVVDEGIELIGEVNLTLERTAKNSSEASQAVEIIAQAVGSTARSAETISAAAKQIATMSKDITTTTNRQSDGTRQLLEEVSNMRVMSLQVNQAMREQENVAEMISNAAEAARSMTERIRDATSNEAEHSDKVVSSLENLRSVFKAGLDSVKQLNTAIAKVNENVDELKDNVTRFKT